MKTNVSIFGIGNFGYAILNHLNKHKDYTVSIKAYDIVPEVVNSLIKNHTHPTIHPHSKIGPSVKIVRSAQELLLDCDILILAVSSNASRAVLSEIKPYIKDSIIIVNTSKALDYESGKRLSEIVADELGGVNYQYALFAGGTIAHDLFHGEPLGADMASEDAAILPGLVSIFSSTNLSVYPTDDLLGTEYAAAFKNIVAIAAGITKGLGFSYGAETHIISKTAGQIANVCVEEYDAKADTFSMGRQAWGNDLWMSCTGNTRNREFGILLGKGLSVNKAVKQMEEAGKTVEGINTLRAFDVLPAFHGIPLLSLMHALIIQRTESISAFKDHLLGSMDLTDTELQYKRYENKSGEKLKSGPKTRE